MQQYPQVLAPALSSSSSSNCNGGGPDGSTSVTFPSPNGATVGTFGTNTDGATGGSMAIALSTAAALAVASATPNMDASSQPTILSNVNVPLSSSIPLHFSVTTSSLPQNFQILPALPPATLFPSPPAQNQPIFQHMKLRRGKWTQEEEDYAEALIEEFEKGTVQGCENGCTLRAFLSRKLHCAPMRISKKYAGKSIGKHVFLSRTNMTGIKQGTPTTDNTAKILELEVKFYKSLFQDIDGPGGLHSPYIGHGPLTPSFLSTQGSQGLSSHSNMFQQPFQLAPGSLVPYVSVPTPLSIQGQVNGIQSNSLWPIAMPPPNSGNLNLPSNTDELHQTYLSALNQMKVRPSPQTLSPEMNAKNETTVSESKYSGGIQGGKPSIAGAASGTPIDTSAMNSNASIMPSARAQVHANSINVHSYRPKPVTESEWRQLNGSCVTDDPNPSVQPLDVPDFLSGFERVAAKAKAIDEQQSSQGQQFANLWSSDGSSLMLGLDSLPTAQYSPPFTSRSFDDFHRLLGKDLSPGPLDLNAVSSENPAVDTDVAASQSHQGERRLASHNSRTLAHTPFRDISVRTEPASKSAGIGLGPPVTADSYAMFAQQSALAVSQHSAYCRASEIGPSGYQIAMEDMTSTRYIQALSGGNQLGSVSPVDNPERSTSVVNAANLKVHAEATQNQSRKHDSSNTALSKNGHGLNTSTQSFSRQHRNMISGSERSSEVGTEENESALGSSRGSGSESNTASDNASDNTSNDSDSNSDEGPPRKKSKSVHQQVNRKDTVMSANREVVSPVSFDRSTRSSQ